VKRLNSGHAWTVVPRYRIYLEQKQYAATTINLRLAAVVIPAVPVRQCVLSLPHVLRYKSAFDAPLLSQVLNIFVGAVFGWLKRQARECGIPRGQCGAVTFIQRFGSALNLTPHFYLVAFDGPNKRNKSGWRIRRPRPDRPQFHIARVRLLPNRGRQDSFSARLLGQSNVVQPAWIAG
jgi:Putative transposase